MNKNISFIKLDFATIKPYKRSLYFYVLIMLLVGFTSKSFNVIFSMIIAGFPIILSYPFAISEKNGLDTLYSTLSLDRKDVVIGRYSFVVFIKLIAMALLTIFASVNFNWNSNSLTIGEASLYISLLFLILSLLISFQYPLFFKYGYTKAKIYTYIPLFLLFFCLGILPSILMKLGVYINWNKLSIILDNNKTSFSILFILIGFVFLLISCLISIKIYQKKDI
mgnify:CR=1 FL=1